MQKGGQGRQSISQVGKMDLRPSQVSRQTAVRKSKPKKPVPKRRVFSTCEQLDGELLKRLAALDEQRKLRALQRQSQTGWRKTWSVLQEWTRQMFRIIVTFTEDPLFDHFILFVVVLNTGTLVAQTFESATVRGGWFFSALDCTFLAIYLMECVLKLLVWGRLYFKNLWNDLDFFIIVMSFVDFVLPLMESAGSFSGGQASTVFRILKIFKGVRAIRAFRVLRTIRFLQNLQSIVSTCLQSLQSMGAIILLMFTFLFMFAVIFREMFSGSDPERFGTLFRTVFTLFQLLTLDDWAFIYSTSRDRGSPHIIIFLVLYILVEYFTFLNLFIAVLVDNFQLTIKKRMVSKIQRFQDVYEGEMESIKKIELQSSEPQNDQEFYEESLKLTYSDNKYSKREKDLIAYYLRLLAAIDQNQQAFRSQTCVLERLIDTFFEATVEDIQGNDND